MPLAMFFFNWASPENVSRLHDPLLVANIRVSLVQGSMLLQLNVVIVAFLINIDKKNGLPCFFLCSGLVERCM